MSGALAPAWPTVGSVWVDAIGRTLHVTQVQPGSSLGRHVVGTINSQAYACDLPTFEAIWRERRVASDDAEDYRPRQAYADGRPVRRR